MNTALFISKKIFTKERGSFSNIVFKVATVSISLGVLILIVSFSVLNGFNSTIKEKIFGFSGHLQITKYGSNTGFEELPLSRNTAIYRKADSINFVKNIYAYANKPALLKSDEGIQGVVIKGLDEKFLTSTFEKLMKSGRFIEFNDTTDSKEVVISQKLSDLLQLNLGDDALFYFIQDPPRIRKLKVVGIYSSGLEEFDEQYVYSDIKIIQKLNGWEDSLVGGYEVNVSDFNNLDDIALSIYDEMDYYLSLVKITDLYYQLFDWFKLLATNINMLFIVVIVVVCVNLLSSFTIIILEKTNDIGTLKALGAKNSLIQKIFLFNGLKMLLKGLFYGNIIGILFSIIQQKFKLIPLDEENYYMSYVPIKLELEPIILVNIIIIFFVITALVIPTFYISTIKPIKSIKFD